MVELDPQRFFSASQRQMLFTAAEGRCQWCSAELLERWHADHRIPWADGGHTTIENGQALCDACNHRKGRQMQFRDDFAPRPFQEEVINQVLGRLRANLDRTVVLASPGSGKTLAYQSLATRLYREDLITNIAVFVPRTALAQQCETSWMNKTANGEIRGLCLLFDGTKRLGMIRHKVNETPLTVQSQPGSGFVSTYSALVTNEAVFLNWATVNQDRFLLIADEAQFCGDTNDADNGGTRAGELIKRMHDYARHTLLLTGTPYRADNQPLILADYEPDPANPKRRKLVHHAEASYADGIAEGYLRKFELNRTDSRVSKRTLNGQDGTGESLVEYNLSDDGSELVPVLRDEKTWKPLVDRVVSAVRDKQVFNRQYRGLISCMGQKEARRVTEYLQATYPSLKVKLAVSSDTEAPQALADFKFQEQDVLVTVRMAFIGYDCPQITVVGVLTHYRDGGHLMQLVGRGLRVWKEMAPRAQSCVIIAPDDPKMQGFLELLRDESEAGLRLVEEREREAAEKGSVQEALSYVESAVAAGTRASSNEVDMDVAEVVLVEQIKHEVESAETVTKLKQVIELAGLRLKVQTAVPQPCPEPGPPPVFEVPKTEREQIEEIKGRVRDAVTSHLAKKGITPDAPGYQEAVTRAMAQVKRASCSADEANTVEKANRRLQAALSLT
ncbi:HNH endonuclease [Spongiactinospora sp. TRM90649]|uniref:DEAD/DEAH box helicase n=1 Tax=Spongiactinospora sp. TRM90649 TaxID=3031114 RepID=UPI0023F71F23|nr:HNH endonuclease [Spongiactinospora sp. TRM90649]MDF5758375.1 HNH endonuclease [Spongiactinospora sp. TRM90649]